jgi:dTDP-4-amino-4,6-dideoxygalactose transaminase
MAADKPVLLGGRPLLTERLPMVRPVIPDHELVLREAAVALASGMLTKGSNVRHYEEEVAAHLGVRHAIAVSSCTSGLMLVYRSLPPGEIIVPSFTFMATVSALVWAGHSPVFTDVDRATMNLDPDALEWAVTQRTRAVLAVHNFGNPADITRLEDFAAHHRLQLLFDAAHGFGASYGGVAVARHGMAQVFSTSPTKLVVSGEGGIVATDDDDLADFVRAGREYGMAGGYDSLFPGISARMPELSAIVGRKSLGVLAAAVARRNEVAAHYRAQMGQLPGIGFQSVLPGSRSAFKDFAITVEPSASGLSRDVLASALTAEGIDNRSYYSPPVHRQTAYLPERQTCLPNTEWLADNILCLPIWSEMPDDVVSTISHALTRIWEHGTQLRGMVNASDHQ